MDSDAYTCGGCRHGNLQDNCAQCEKEAAAELMREQEPVAWAATDEDGKIEALSFNQSRRRFDTPLYAAPIPASVPDIAKRMAELNRRLREPEWHFESIREFQRELTVLEGMALAAELVPMPPSVPESCKWALTEPTDEGMWESACGAAWTFIDGGPTENGMRFCLGCGKPLEVVAPKLGDE